jgi:hypothetical protein
MSIEDYKNEEVENVILRITFQGAFQRAKVYSANALEPNRLKFRAFLAKKLKVILHKIPKIDNYDDNMHYSIIKDFANEISDSEFKDLIAGGRFRIGIAQKLINLYWKYSWILKPNIATPIHCPFDSIVINDIIAFKEREKVNWTEFDEKDDVYLELVEKAKQFSGDKYSSIAEMELVEYQLFLQKSLGG